MISNDKDEKHTTQRNGPITREEKIKLLKQAVNKNDYIDYAISKIADELIHLLNN